MSSARILRKPLRCGVLFRANRRQRNLHYRIPDVYRCLPKKPATAHRAASARHRPDPSSRQSVPTSTFRPPCPEYPLPTTPGQTYRSSTPVKQPIKAPVNPPVQLCGAEIRYADHPTTCPLLVPDLLWNLALQAVRAAGRLFERGGERFGHMLPPRQATTNQGGGWWLAPCERRGSRGGGRAGL